MSILDETTERLLIEAEQNMRGATKDFPSCSLEMLLHLVEYAPELARVARAVSELAQDEAGKRFEGKTVTVKGIEYERSKPPPKRTGWRNDELQSAVLDSRLVDPESGEVADESPLDKVLHVWSLGAPRTTALTARGLDADDWCHKTWPDDMPWKVAPATQKKGRKK